MTRALPPILLSVIIALGFILYFDSKSNDQDHAQIQALTDSLKSVALDKWRLQQDTTRLRGYLKNMTERQRVLNDSIANQGFLIVTLRRNINTMKPVSHSQPQADSILRKLYHY